MFSTLRLNSPIYILDKKDSPVLKRGIVELVSPQRSKTGSFYGQLSDMVVDITVNIEGTSQEFKNIPANLTIASDGTIVLSETKEALSSEVDALLSLSKQIIDSVDYHKEVIGKCEQILKELNPQFAKDKIQEEKITSLETRIGGVESNLNDIKDMLTKVLNK
jgi:hypothetical protein